jgi:Lar family restriction alleviation protein
MADRPRMTDAEWSEYSRRRAELLAKCKPCPFCGGSEYLSLEIVDHQDGYGFSGALACLKCQAYGPWAVDPIEATAERQAVELWNRRK